MYLQRVERCACRPAQASMTCFNDGMSATFPFSMMWPKERNVTVWLTHSAGPGFHRNLKRQRGVGGEGGGEIDKCTEKLIRIAPFYLFAACPAQSADCLSILDPWRWDVTSLAGFPLFSSFLHLIWNKPSFPAKSYQWNGASSPPWQLRCVNVPCNLMPSPVLIVCCSCHRQDFYWVHNVMDPGTVISLFFSFSPKAATINLSFKKLGLPRTKKAITESNENLNMISKSSMWNFVEENYQFCEYT